MTFRVYVRWPESRVSDKTSTESRSVAQAAFDELLSRRDSLVEQGAVGITFTEDGKQIRYETLGEGEAS